MTFIILYVIDKSSRYKYFLITENCTFYPISRFTLILPCFYFYRADNDFVFIGYSNGVLRVHSLSKGPKSKFSLEKNDPINWTTENYWTISLHSPTGGSIREIYTIETQQDHLLVCCGQDGGIFAHKINQALDGIYQKAVNEKVN